MRRRQPPAPAAPSGLPADLAAGPCVELWADPAEACPVTSARARWRAARLAWCRSHNLMDTAGDRLDYRRIPPELYDRAPFYRKDSRA